uniref:Uncharacterized protein n=1 Tax=Setaria italica TaxID=4555 RepID=K4AGR4_SETIT
MDGYTPSPCSEEGNLPVGSWSGTSRSQAGEVAGTRGGAGSELARRGKPIRQSVCPALPTRHVWRAHQLGLGIFWPRSKRDAAGPGASPLRPYPLCCVTPRALGLLTSRSNGDGRWLLELP